MCFDTTPKAALGVLQIQRRHLVALHAVLDQRQDDLPLDRRAREVVDQATAAVGALHRDHRRDIVDDVGEQSQRRNRVAGSLAVAQEHETMAGYRCCCHGPCHRANLRERAKQQAKE